MQPLPARPHGQPAVDDVERELHLEPAPPAESVAESAVDDDIESTIVRVRCGNVTRSARSAFRGVRVVLTTSNGMSRPNSGNRTRRRASHASAGQSQRWREPAIS